MLKINLLPPEIEENKKLLVKRNLVTRLSVGLMVFVTICAAVSLGAEVVQNIYIRNLNNKILGVKAQVTELKDEEGLVVVLKNRLEGIGSLIRNDSPQAIAFNIITDLIPQGVSLGTFNVDNRGKVLMSGETNSTTSLQNFFDNLTNNNPKIKAVSIESLSQGVGGGLRFDITVILADGALAATK